MGKFKTDLEKLKTSLEKVDKQLENYSLSVTLRTTEMAQACGVWTAGYEVAYLYLVQKYKSRNMDVKQHPADELRSLLANDKQLANMVVNIESARKLAIAKRKQYEAIRDVIRSTLTENDVNSAQVKALKTALAKKENKLIKTPNYKNKVANYRSVLNGLEKSLGEYKTILTQSVKDAISLEILSRDALTADTTMEDIGIRAKSSDLEASLNEATNNAAETGKKLRNSQKFIKADMALMKDWIKEADDMEKSAEEI